MEGRADLVRSAGDELRAHEAHPVSAGDGRKRRFAGNAFARRDIPSRSVHDEAELLPHRAFGVRNETTLRPDSPGNIRTQEPNTPSGPGSENLRSALTRGVLANKQQSGSFPVEPRREMDGGSAPSQEMPERVPKESAGSVAGKPGRFVDDEEVPVLVHVDEACIDLRLIGLGRTERDAVTGAKDPVRGDAISVDRDVPAADERPPLHLAAIGESADQPIQESHFPVFPPDDRLGLSFHDSAMIDLFPGSL